MKHRVYIETSVISYLTVRLSNDPIKSACQNITRLWWDGGCTSGIVFISPYVVEEASAGDSICNQRTIEVLRSLPVLPIAPEILELAEFLLLGGGLPTKAKLDALHIACAAYHEIDVLLTWNCNHIANPAKLPVMRGLCAARGYRLPELVTPFELMENLQCAQPVPGTIQLSPKFMPRVNVWQMNISMTCSLTPRRQKRTAKL